MAISRDYQTGTKATMTNSVLRERFKNTLTRVSDMIKSNNIYSTWIKLTIGKGDFQLTFDSSSTDKNKNMIMSMEFEKSGAGSANSFKVNIAYDLFNFGQETKGQVEKLDELLYRAMNIAQYDNYADYFYTKFQYGYNILGDTQIVSPLYEGFITDISPNVDYNSGKTSYVIEGTSIVAAKNASVNDYTYNQIGVSEDSEEGTWNGIDLVLWNLWYYMGNPETVDDIVKNVDDSYADNIGNQHPDVLNGVVSRVNIDIPKGYRECATNVYMPAREGITPIEYCKQVLAKTRNKNDSRYNAKTGEYDLKDGESAPYFTLYITDSGGGGVPTVHVVYVSTMEDSLNNNSLIDFNFEWYTRTNNLVVGWKPEVSVRPYLLLRAQRDHQRAVLETENEKAKAEAEKTIQETQAKLDKAQSDLNTINAGVSWQAPLQGPGLESVNRARLVNNIKNIKAYTTAKLNQNASSENIAGLQTEIAKTQATLNDTITRNKERMEQLSDSTNIEFYKAQIQLVGVPSDIPIGAILNIKPKILESVSRTQGRYFITKSKDVINTNGLFVTTIELQRLYSAL